MEALTTPAAAVHLHLLLNHVPTVGTVAGVGLFLLALVRQNDDLAKASLEVLFVVGLVTLPAYMSGAAAVEVLKSRGDFAAVLVADHQNAALFSLVWVQLTAGAAWFALWQFRRRGRPSRTALASTFVLMTAGLVAAAYTAALGGLISHPEIDAASTAGTSSPAWLDTAAIAEFTLNNGWVWPAAESLHFVGMSLSFGMLLVVNLHLSGAMPGVTFAAVHRLLPWGILGLGLNVATGILFFNATAPQYVENPAFFWKILLFVLAGLNYLYLTVFEEPWLRAAARRTSVSARLLGMTALLLWMGVLYFGRMLPYLRSAL